MTKTDRYEHLTDAPANEEATEETSDGETDDTPTQTPAVPDHDRGKDAVAAVEPASPPARKSTDNESVEHIDDGVSVTVQDGETEHVLEFEGTDITIDDVVDAIEENSEKNASVREGTTSQTPVVSTGSRAAMFPFQITTKVYTTVLAGTLTAGTAWWLKSRRTSDADE